jgi:hypothetical protein
VAAWPHGADMLSEDVKLREVCELLNNKWAFAINYFVVRKST